MNRAQRRHREAIERRQRAARHRALRRFFAEAAGLFTMQIVRPDGDPGPVVHLAINDWFRAVLSGQLDPLCLCCDNEFRDGPPAAFIAALPYRDGAMDVIVSGLCGACAGWPDDDAIEMATAAWRRHIVPGLRRLPAEHFAHTAGRA